MISAATFSTPEATSPSINLRERFRDRYKIEYEESYSADRKNITKADEVALQIIPCTHGHIFPWGGDRLAASTNKSGKIANRLRSLDCCRVEQDGDGVNVSFHVDDFDAVAAVMRPIERPKLSPERRKALIEAGRAHKFVKSTGQTKVFRGQNASKRTKATSESPVRFGAKRGSEKVNSFQIQEGLEPSDMVDHFWREQSQGAQCDHATVLA